MASDAQADETEHELARDLGALSDEELHDDSFAGELYRGLANHRLVDPDDPERRQVSLSWRRAEEVVNGLRRHVGEEPLTLAQTGGEGSVTERVEAALTRLGWSVRPLDTSSHDSSHVSEPNSPGPKGQGERDAPTEPPGAWREADAEADRR